MHMIQRPSPYMIDAPGREVPPHDAPSSRQRRTFDVGGFCLIFAALCGLTGMTAGIAMGILQDFTIAPAHAHLNLLGWVTMALYGLYHRSIGRTGGWLGWIQVLTGAAGAVNMGGGLALYLSSGHDRYFQLVLVGSLLAFLGMVLFVVILLADLLGFSRSRNWHGNMAG
jgi:hypothetical protein